MNKKLLVSIVIVTALSGVIAYKFYTKKHRMIDEEPYLSISASELFDSFDQNEAEANKLYLNKVIQVNGILSEVLANQQNQTVVVLQSTDPLFGVSCTLEKNTSIRLSAGDSIVVKGICTGYLSDVVLTNCSLTTAH